MKCSIYVLLFRSHINLDHILRRKWLYRITLGTKTTATEVDKLVKWANKNDSTCGLIDKSVSPELRFHLQNIDDPDKSWTKLNTIFGTQNEIHTHQLENEFLTLDPNNFSCMEDFLSKFKTLRLLLKGCNVKKEDSSLLYSILAKLGPTYSMFVSTFHSTREAIISHGGPYKPPTFDAFCDSLIREKEKLLHLGLINTASTATKALVAQQPHRPKNNKNPKKLHPKKNTQNNKGPKSS